MKSIVFILFLLTSLNAFSQANEVDRVNHLLETETFFNIRLDYQANLTLPDSVVEKFLATLRGEVPQRIADSILFVSEQNRKRMWDFAKNECRGDSICAIELYERLLQEELGRRHEHLFNRFQINRTVVLAAGSWNIREAIPILENAIGNGRYDQQAVLMALARLGNDSIKQIFMDRYTLSYVLKNTQADTINDDALIHRLPIKPWSVTEAIQTAMYLQSKEMLLNILDLIYIRGLSEFCIGSDCSNVPRVSLFVWNFALHNGFSRLPNRNALIEIASAYVFAIWELPDRRLNRRERQELDRLLSTEHRTKVKNQIRDWIIENVNFD